VREASQVDGRVDVWAGTDTQVDGDKSGDFHADGWAKRADGETSGARKMCENQKLSNRLG
jgi:hypothetical protein